MKTAILTTSLAVLLFATACQRNTLLSDGAITGFTVETGSGSYTKTSYSGALSGSPSKERIDWVVGDQFKVACAQTTPQLSSYQISGGITASGALSRATEIVPVGHPNANGLHWGTETHHFYAVYPSSVSLTPAGLISASLPALQDGNMGNCLMWAGTDAEPKNEFTLRFTPMVTTFQFTVGGDGTGAGDITVNAVELVSENVALTGDFKAVITEGGPTAEIAQRGGSISYSEIPGVSTSNNTVRFTPPSGTIINDTQSLTFRVFVYPQGRVVGGEDVMDGLTLRYYTDKGNRSLALKYGGSAPENAGQWVQFPAGCKINVTGLQMPAQLNPWRFSVETSALEEELSDVAVHPVAIEAWTDTDDLIPIDEWQQKMFISPESSGVWVGDEITLTAFINNGGSVSEATAASWTLSDAGGTYVTVVSSNGSSITLRGLNSTAGESPVVIKATQSGLAATAKLAVKKLQRSGAFSVADGRYVYFSPGNLQYVFGSWDVSFEFFVNYLFGGWENVPVGESGYSGYWRFASYQYEYIGPLDHEWLVTNRTEGTAIDLFSWGIIGIKYEEGQEFVPWTYDPSIYSSRFGPTSGNLTGLSDWGANTITGAEPSTGWRMMTSEEYAYLTANWTNWSGGHRIGWTQLFGTARVAGVKGLVLLPDDWVRPAGMPEFVSGVNADFGGNPTYMVINNTYSAEEWELMEAAGAVFLPTTGVIQHNYPNYIVKDYQNAQSYDYIFYWTATRDIDNFGWSGASSLSVTSGGAGYNYRGRAAKLPVRLVRDAEDVTHGLSTGLSSYAMRFSLAAPNNKQATGVSVKYNAADVTEDASITWTCSPRDLVKMTPSQDGKSVSVTPVAKGKGTITCHVTYGNERREMECRFLIED